VDTEEIERVTALVRARVEGDKAKAHAVFADMRPKIATRIRGTVKRLSADVENDNA
jgi:hypothetical protein